ncbi:alginate lyase family protein [Sodalis sp. RH24]|uniref:alginate lyase family protein n=1 Tax=unclassified Sodalis (in: enterobacteria) TaxID=2636512 RepID=UPI0039B6C13E
MANLEEQDNWESGIRQLEQTDRALGGAGGLANLQANLLANRTLYLKNRLELALEQINTGDFTYTSFISAEDPSGTIKGLANTNYDQIFRVPQGTGALASFKYYLNNAGAAVEVAEAVGKAAVDAVAENVDVVRTQIKNFEYGDLPNGRKPLAGVGDKNGSTPLYIDTKGGVRTGGSVHDTIEVISDRYLADAHTDINSRPWFKYFRTGHVGVGLENSLEIPEPVFYLNLPNLYLADNQTVDPSHTAIRAFLRKDLDNFNIGLYTFAMDYAIRGDNASGRMAGRWLYDWAMRRSMTNRNGSQVGTSQDRHWRVPNFGMSYLIAKKEIDFQYRTEIVDWFTDLGAVMIADFANYVPSSNNHSYWCAASVYMCYVITGNTTYRDFALGIYDQAMNRIQDNGTLTTELDRGVKCLSYHSFASEPLVMICEFALQIGEDVYNRNAKLFNLLETTFHGMVDPGWWRTNAAVSAIQEPVESAGWPPFILLRYPDLNNYGLTLDVPQWGDQFFMGQNGGSTQLAKLWVK